MYARLFHSQILNKEKIIYLYIKISIFLELSMNHDHHHHADVVTKANTVMNHGQHMMPPQTNTGSGVSGHESHTKDMMMMTVSIRFTLIMEI